MSQRALAALLDIDPISVSRWERGKFVPSRAHRCLLARLLGGRPNDYRMNDYQSAAETLLRETGCTVRKWRKQNTGCAYTQSDDWGIESPEPRGPISFGVFAHEVGHQMKHRFNSAPRWLEEIEAWEYALDQFIRFELPGRDEAKTRAAKSITYAARKASRRCSPSTATRILNRVPDWVDELHPSRVWFELYCIVAEDCGDNLADIEKAFRDRHR